MQIDRILKEIQEEAQVRKSQPPHPDSQYLKKIRIQIVEPPPPLFFRAIQKLHQYGWQSPKMFYLRIASIPKWGYPLLLLRDLVRLPTLRKRIQDTNDLLESHFIALNQRIETELWPRHEEQIRIMNSRLIEALNYVESLANVKVKRIYYKTNRVGDHIWYISDIKKFRKHYPNWKQKYDTKKIIKELIYSFQ